VHRTGSQSIAVFYVASTMCDWPFAGGAVHLTYCLTGSLEGDAIGAAVAQLSTEERQRHDRFRFEDNRREFALAHALLRRCLSARRDREPDTWRFTVDRNGKPQLAPEDAQTHLVFNLSHTAGLVACAVGSDADIGVDAERVDRGTDVLELAERFFASSEIADLRRLDERDRPTRFIELWTLKEAFIKAIGEGLSCPLNAFSFSFGNADSLHFACARPTRARVWSFVLFAPSPEHRMAIAVGTNSVVPPALLVDPELMPLRRIVATRLGLV
jgi:4'-phosphopantetheinyl transferase